MGKNLELIQSALYENELLVYEDRDVDADHTDARPLLGKVKNVDGMFTPGAYAPLPPPRDVSRADRVGALSTSGAAPLPAHLQQDVWVTMTHTQAQHLAEMLSAVRDRPGGSLDELCELLIAATTGGQDQRVHYATRHTVVDLRQK